MTTVIAVALALIVAAIQARRHRTDTRPAAVIDTYLVWWLVLAIGLSSVVGAAFHVFDGPAIAEMIGYSRGDGGFQFENAMGDLAIGVTGVLCFWFRGYFWLALLTVTTIQYFGDAAGHVYFWIAEDNTKSGNIGAPLWFDIILPVVGFTLYALSYRRGGDARPVGART